MNKCDHSQDAESCHLMLFIAGDGPNSFIACKNLVELNKELAGRFTMEIVDILEDFTAAVVHDILVTPTLLISTSKTTMLVMGNLSDREKVRAALRQSVIEA